MTGLEIIGLAATGFFAGIFGTMIGIGGGVIFVPIFLLVFHYTSLQAAGTSLFAVFFNALSGTISYLRQKRVDIKSGIKFMLATIPGAFLGTWLSQYLSSNVFGTIFAFLLIIMSAYLFLRKEPHIKKVGAINHTRAIADAHGHFFEYSPKLGRGIALSFLVGVLSSLLGIGGGIIHVPAMIYFLGFPVHIATATSHFVLAGSSFFGSISHLAAGHVLILPAIIVGGAAIPGALIGAAISHRLKGRLIIRLLAVVLAFLGLRLLLKSLGVY
jgi:uncharacterized membrane protein YfcA